MLLDLQSHLFQCLYPCPLRASTGMLAPAVRTGDHWTVDVRGWASLSRSFLECRCPGLTPGAEESRESQQPTNRQR
eukprot:1306481-Rhodomonas_salina.2